MTLSATSTQPLRHRAGTSGRTDPAAARLMSFERARPKLLGVAYRLVGTVADAEDVVHEAWLRWSGVDVDSVDNHDAYLTTVTARLALDRLRRVRRHREVYTGAGLREPVAVCADPAEAVELADSLSRAVLVLLETMTPLERAAFVLHEVFQRGYRDVAAALERSEPAVRQLVHRARARVDSGRARYRADAATHAHVVERFVAACQSAEVTELMDVLAPGVGGRP